MILDEWRRENHRYLMTALGIVADELRRYVARMRDEAEPLTDPALQEEILSEMEASLAMPPMLTRLAELLGLSSFERKLVMLAAGRDLDPEFDMLCALAQGSSGVPYPTLRLALELWPDGEREALAPHASLARFGVIELDAGPTAMTRPFRLSERALYYLEGIGTLDETLQGILEPIRAPYAESAASLDSLEGSVRDLAETIIHASREGGGRIIQLCGDEYASKQAIAAAAASALRMPIHLLDAGDIPHATLDRDRLARLWELESLLGDAVLFIDCETVESADATRAATAFLERAAGAIVVATRDPLRLRRGAVRIDVRKPGAVEQIALWHEALGDTAARMTPAIEAAVAQFNLGMHDIDAVGNHVAARMAEEPLADGGAILWDACRTHARPRLEGLAERIEARATWDDLVLPESHYQTMRELVAHVRQRMKVYEQWGLARQSSRGLGMSALFAGASGTGKTLSAEVIASELQLDLYHIDLSQVVSKYIGETEKNLRRIFDAAEEAGAVLLFDEADALFGKRSEVKDSHDRHANIEVSYLLQKMESYRGLAILTTNLKDSLDTAFLRRIRFVVNFPFPDPASRAEIWRRIYPDELPKLGLDYDKLSKLNVSGGNIRNIAINAAFLAADEGAPVQMHHLLRAARSEYIKLEKPLTEIEIKEWVRKEGKR